MSGFRGMCMGAMDSKDTGAASTVVMEDVEDEDDEPEQGDEKEVEVLRGGGGEEDGSAKFRERFLVFLRRRC